MQKLWLFVVSILISGTGFADVELQIKDGQSGLSTISSDGKKARIESAGMPGFVIVDFTAGKLSMVNPERQQVINMDMSENGGGGTAAGSVQVSFT